MGSAGRRSCRSRGGRYRWTAAISVRHLGRHCQRGGTNGREMHVWKRRSYEGHLEQVSSDFEGEALGELEVKGKGRISVFGHPPKEGLVCTGLMSWWGLSAEPRPITLNARELDHRCAIIGGKSERSALSPQGWRAVG